MKKRKSKRKEEEEQRQRFYIVKGESKHGLIRRVYPYTPAGHKEAERDADRCRSKKGYRNIEVVET